MLRELVRLHPPHSNNSCDLHILTFLLSLLVHLLRISYYRFSIIWQRFALMCFPQKPNMYQTSSLGEFIYYLIFFSAMIALWCQHKSVVESIQMRDSWSLNCHDDGSENLVRRDVGEQMTHTDGDQTLIASFLSEAAVLTLLFVPFLLKRLPPGPVALYR